MWNLSKHITWGAEPAPRHCPALKELYKITSDIKAQLCINDYLKASSPETFRGSHSRTAISKHPKCFSFIIKRVYHKEASRGSQPGTEQKGSSLSCVLPTTSGSSLKGCTKHSSLHCPCWWQHLLEENRTLKSNPDSWMLLQFGFETRNNCLKKKNQPKPHSFTAKKTPSFT